MVKDLIQTFFHDGHFVSSEIKIEEFALLHVGKLINLGKIAINRIHQKLFKMCIRDSTKRSLLYDLCGKLVMGKTVSGENRKLLSADQGCQTVDGGDAGTDIVTRIFTGNRI